MTRTRFVAILRLYLLTIGCSGKIDEHQGVLRIEAGDVQTLKERAAQGDAEAQYNLGLMHYFGFGVFKDYEEALKWFRLAAAQGDAQAQYSLGVMHAQGQGIPQNRVEARKWFCLAAAQGVASAQYSLGAMYALGYGVRQDYEQAHMWFNLAAERATGELRDNSITLRDFVAESMTPDQLADALVARSGVKQPTEEAGRHGWKNRATQVARSGMKQPTEEERQRQKAKQDLLVARARKWGLDSALVRSRVKRKWSMARALQTPAQGWRGKVLVIPAFDEEMET